MHGDSNTTEVASGHTDGRVADQPGILVDGARSQRVAAVAVTIVDNAGIARVKTIPVSGLERAAQWGVGLSPVFNVCLVDDSFTTSRGVGGPTGDLRLIPDVSALRIIASEPGWMWAPADQRSQDGEPFGCCQRSFLKRMVERARVEGLELRFGLELEWFLGAASDEQPIPVHNGPGYGFAILAELSEYARDIMTTLAESEVEIGQLHPEYAPGQFEVSLGAADPLSAADVGVIARHLIRAVSARCGYRVSFAPVVVPDRVGNGGHLHLSLWRDGRNLLAGGAGPHGMTEAGAAFVAGVLVELPALMAVGAPSVASYVRLRPSHWAGAYACWGRENREAGLRFVTGMRGNEQPAANCEVKCFDQSANPYLAIGAVIAAGLEGIKRGMTLPPEVVYDPAALPVSELRACGIDRLPSSLEGAVFALERSEVLRAAMGPMLFDAFAAVRRAEEARFAQEDPEAIAAAHRWRY